MTDWCVTLKNILEQSFSMSFDVSLSLKDGEEQYTCFPSNKDDEFFTVKAYIHDQIRLVVEIAPQKNAGAILNDISMSDTSQRKIFFQYIEILNAEKAKISFTVNNEHLSNQGNWPKIWRFFKCRIDIIPIPELNSEEELLNLLAKWLTHGTALILSLLTIEEDDPCISISPDQEGKVKELKSIRYERSRVNRDICLAHKGYSCSACGFNFLERYGQLGKDYIEVHHTTPVSEMGDNYQIDIDRDLVPVCSNCHSMLHRKTPPYTIKELKNIIIKNGGNLEAFTEKVKIIKVYPECQTNYIPLYSIRAACGYFEGGELPEETGWIDASGYGFKPDPKRHFVVYAKGDSMLPKIKDGDLCVFEWYRAGSRNGEIVLTESCELDSGYGGMYTIKKYYSEKINTEDCWQHTKVELRPLNPEFHPINLDEDGDYRTIGIFKCTL